MCVKVRESTERNHYRREILSYFSEHAHSYDRSATIISLGKIGRVRKWTAEMLSLTSGDRVLDLCTGTGETARYLLTAGYKAVGIDFSFPMLRQALKKRGRHRIPLLHGDALYLPFRDDSFRGTTISFGFHEMPLEVMEEIVKETARVLKSGGMLVITDWNLPSNPLVRAFFNPFIYVIENSYCSGFLKTDLIRLMKKHGFHLVEQRLAGLGCVAIRSFQMQARPDGKALNV